MKRRAEEKKIIKDMIQKTTTEKLKAIQAYKEIKERSNDHSGHIKQQQQS